MSSVSALYRQRSNSTPEEARDIRARAWAYVFECYTKKGGVPSTAPNDAMKGSKSDSANTRLP